MKKVVYKISHPCSCSSSGTRSVTPYQLTSNVIVTVTVRPESMEWKCQQRRKENVLITTLELPSSLPLNSTPWTRPAGQAKLTTKNEQREKAL